MFAGDPDPRGATLATGDLVLDGTPHRLDPRAKTRWLVERCAFGAILGLVLVVVGLFSYLEWTFIGLGFAVVWTAIAAVSASLSYRYWSWSAHEDALELSHGIIQRKLSVVPYHRIQQIDIERGPVERMLHIATLVLRSAAATTDAKIPGIGLDHADQLRHALLARSGIDDAV